MAKNPQILLKTVDFDENHRFSGQKPWIFFQNLQFLMATADFDENYRFSFKIHGFWQLQIFFWNLQILIKTMDFDEN